MSTFKDRGIVIKEMSVGESDKMVTLLLKEHGKVTVSARGAKNQKSKLAPATQLFAYCDYIIFQGNGFLSITQGELIENFYCVRDEFERFCYGCFFLEMTDKMIFAQMPVKKVLFLLIKSLQALSKKVIPAALVSVIFQFKFMQIEGLSPITSKCAVCGESELNERYFGGNGIICRNCISSNVKYTKISEPSICAIEYILSSETAELFNFSVSDAVLNELKDASDIFRQINLDFHFKSLELML